MKIDCPSCRQSFHVPDLPPPAIANLIHCSVAVFEHPVPYTCSCGQQFAPVIGKVASLAVGYQPIEKKTISGIVIPGR